VYWEKNGQFFHFAIKLWRVVLCPRLATVARRVFPCPRLAINTSADSRLRLQLCRLCRLASAQLTIFPNSVLCTQLNSLYSQTLYYVLNSLCNSCHGYITWDRPHRKSCFDTSEWPSRYQVTATSSVACLANERLSISYEC
jgi:hypothetical protein